MKLKILFFGLSIATILMNGEIGYSQCESDETKNMCISKSTEVAVLTPANQNHEEEVNPQIPELSEYHEVIYQIWHNGWPNKDYELLKSLYPDAREGYTKLQKVKMRGILQDKQKQWEDSVNQLGKYLDDYNNAIQKNDNKALLDAAEKLHSQYESLVRIINPVLKEIEDFHKSLYMLYHYDYPNYDLDKIQKDLAELSKKMDELNKAELPQKLQSIQKDFEESRAELDKAMKNLEETMKEYSNNKDKISKSIEEMHEAYQNLEGIFENK
ncbi:MAG TPA: hypothetical protein PLC04_08615 [Candidatus Kapabacteria bacterium]|nr:hypothetical protein [Candidatus Kapabacteria bacterium]HOV93119.1 hypothetical protein [Candidatus Kapabacteria bacterium]